MRTTRLPALFSCLCAIPSVLLAHERPNVVVILTDDQGYGDFSGHGNANLSTPRLEALARSGARFSAFHVQPVCSPTRAEFLTGRYHPRGGVHGVSQGGERLDLDEMTIAECFAAAGYRTAMFGKWHNGTQGPYHPLARGFETFYGFTSGHWGSYVDPLLDEDGHVVQGNGFLPDDLTDHAIAYVRERRDEPFFLYLAYNTPHSPMQVPEADWERFRERDIVRRGTQSDQEELDHTRAALALCENLDRNVGRLTSTLVERGLHENTIVAFFCDNGPNGHRFNQGLRGTKGSTDEGGTRSALYVSWPDVIPAGRRVDVVSGAIDLLPTLLDLADVPRRGALPLDGMSLAEHLRGDPVSWPVRHMYSHWGGRVSVRTNRFHLDHRGKLYDLLEDPGQTRDVTDAYPRVAESLMRQVARWRSGVLDEDPRTHRPLAIGGATHPPTWLPARDATFTGTITRSNRHPNDSFLTNWTRVDDRVSWNVDVLEEGTYRAKAYVTCRAEDRGCMLELSAGQALTSAIVDRAFDPPLRGAEWDRSPRIESYVKDWMPLDLGTLRLERGATSLELRAPNLSGERAVDFRLLLLTFEG